jgi:hypothetical protein
MAVPCIGFDRWKRDRRMKKHQEIVDIFDPPPENPEDVVV